MPFFIFISPFGLDLTMALLPARDAVVPLTEAVSVRIPLKNMEGTICRIAVLLVAVMVAANHGSLLAVDNHHLAVVLAIGLMLLLLLLWGAATIPFAVRLRSALKTASTKNKRQSKAVSVRTAASNAKSSDNNNNKPNKTNHATKSCRNDHERKHEEHLQRQERKEEFQSRVHDDYGYASSPAGHIDSWRAKELPYLIAPLATSSLSDDDGDETTTYNNNNGDTYTSKQEEAMVYLDYAGAALPTGSQLDRIHALSRSLALANPHSTGPAAHACHLRVEQSKKAILDFFGANPGRFAAVASGSMLPSQQCTAQDVHPGYEIVFTSGATEALRMVAERFPWTAGEDGDSSSSSLLVYPQESHTSVVGMRAPALAQGAGFLSKPVGNILEDLHRSPSSTLLTQWQEQSQERAQSRQDRDCRSQRHDPSHGSPSNLQEGHQTRTVDHLLVLPAECNFSGDRPKELPSIIGNLRAAQNHQNASADALQQTKQRWSVMLDMAKAATSSPINLRKLDPDFACLSFYKLFGEPTGLGCLFVKRSSINLLMGTSSSSSQHSGDKAPASHATGRHYFGGGSVDALLSDADWTVPKSESTLLASLHSGTPHFRAMALALQPGFEQLQRLGGIASIQRHVNCLSAELRRRLSQLQHENGQAAIVLYGFQGCKERRAKSMLVEPGPTVTFNIMRQDGSYVGYNEVAKLAALQSPPIQLRTGCFCNPGACQVALGLTNDDIVSNYETAGHVCGDQIDIVKKTCGRTVLTGAIRASFGKDSLWEDLDALVMFIERLYVSTNKVQQEITAPNRDGTRRQAVLSELYLFPH